MVLNDCLVLQRIYHVIFLVCVSFTVLHFSEKKKRHRRLGENAKMIDFTFYVKCLKTMGGARYMIDTKS